MKQKATVLLVLTMLITGVALSPASRARVAAALKSATLSARRTAAQPVALPDGAYSYKTVRAGPGTLIIVLAGAKFAEGSRSPQWADPQWSGYRVLPFKVASKQAATVHTDANQALPLTAQKKDDSILRVRHEKRLSGSSMNVPAPRPDLESPSVKSAASSGVSVEVPKVSLDKRESGETVVEVATSSIPKYRMTRFSNPARLAVDSDDARSTSATNDHPADTSVLKSVRIGQFRTEKLSAVPALADLKGNPGFDAHATAQGAFIALRPRLLPEPIASEDPAPPAQRDLSKTPETASTTPPAVTDADVAPPVAFREISDRKPAGAEAIPAEERDAAKVDFQSTLPIRENSQLAVAARLLLAHGRTTPEALRARHAAEVLRADRGDSLMEAQAPPPASPAPTPDSTPLYTGEPISLNLKDVDLKDFFRLIHEISGLNIILDPNVSGSVTLVLDSVPWDQALDIVLKDERLGKVLEGNVLRIARIETLTAEQEGQTRLASARMDAAPLVTVFKPINYAKAADIAALLKTWAGGGALTRRGTVLVDARGNTLIVSDVQTQIPTILDVISKIDKKAKQVSIEARVVLANADFTRTLSAALYGRGGIGASTGAGMVTNSTSGIVPPGTVPVTPPPVSGFGEVAIINASSRYLINAVITAQEERDQAKTISRPSIVTQNNIQGMVQQGVQVPIQTTINNTVSVQYYNATLQLTVTPQVTEDNNIFLIINVQNNSVGASISGVGPEIATQQATTSVLVPDGGTVVFGGITVTSRSKSATYVPLLGNIPVLGHLFKTSNVQDQDQELLFFVSPKVLIT